jgi:hypothetical protein
MPCALEHSDTVRWCVSTLSVSVRSKLDRGAVISRSPGACVCMRDRVAVTYIDSSGYSGSSLFHEGVGKLVQS